MKASSFRKVFVPASYAAIVSSSLYYTWWPSGLPGFLLRVLGLVLFAYSAAMGARIHAMYPEKHDEPRDFDKLLTSGPYARCRHPFYSVLILNQFSVPLILGSCLGAVVAASMLPGWVHLVRLEERELLSYWGEKYREYARRTRRAFCPFL